MSSLSRRPSSMSSMDFVPRVPCIDFVCFIVYSSIHEMK